MKKLLSPFRVCTFSCIIFNFIIDNNITIQHYILYTLGQFRSIWFILVLSIHSIISVYLVYLVQIRSILVEKDKFRLRVHIDFNLFRIVAKALIFCFLLSILYIGRKACDISYMSGDLRSFFYPIHISFLMLELYRKCRYYFCWIKNKSKVIPIYGKQNDSITNHNMYMIYITYTTSFIIMFQWFCRSSKEPAKDED